MPAYSRILLPWDSQPQEVVELDRDGLGKGVQMLLMPMGGRLLDLVNPSQVWTPSGNATTRATSNGIAAKFDGVDDYFATTGYANIDGNVGTFFLWAPRIGAQDTYGHVWFGTNTTTAVYYQITAAGTDAGVVNGQEVNGVGVTGIFGTANSSLVFSSNGTAAEKRFFHNGVSKGTPNGNAPAAFAAGAKNFRFGGWIGGATFDVDGDCVIAGWTSEVWSVAQAKAFHDNPNLVFAPRSIWIPVSAGGGGGGVNLVIADSAHAHAADNLGLTLDTFLALQDALHAHSADNLTLSTTGSTDLTVADAAHAHAADNLGLTLDTFLAISEALHAHAADNVVLSTGAVANLVIADGAHAHAADNLAFTLDTWLAIADALHAHGADNLILTLLSNLTIADSTHAHTADNVVLAFPLGALSDAEFRQMYDWLNELHLIHGLRSGAPLVVTPTTRDTTGIDQTISTVGTTTTVTRV